MSKLIGITGGIGSGKSVVSDICRALGYPVYDCDSRAKLLMDRSDSIKSALCEIAGNECVDCDARINRPYLASKLFGDPDVRQKVNALVHSSIHEDIKREVEANAHAAILFVESAIMRTSSLDRLMQSIWLVEAPEDLRVCRVMLRNGMTDRQVRDRINTQRAEYEYLRCTDVHLLLNDERHSLLLQVQKLLQHP